MRCFYIVVQRGHEDLYEALRQAFRSRPGFYVTIDRRTRRRSAPGKGTSERRTFHDEWGAAHFVVAECVEPFGSG